MYHWLTSLAQPQQDAAALERYNRQSEPFGLTLTEEGLTRLMQHRSEILWETKRFEFGGGVLGKLVAAFCDSPYISQTEYEETLRELQELFYVFKTECHDLVSDDELIDALHLIFHEATKGSIDYLSGIEWETMYRIAVSASLQGTELEPPPLNGVWDWEEYE